MFDMPISASLGPAPSQCFAVWKREYDAKRGADEQIKKKKHDKLLLRRKEAADRYHEFHTNIRMLMHAYKNT